MNGSREIVDDFVAAGWTEVRHANHIVLRCPCGKHQTSLSRSAVRTRVRLNARREINKCQKGT